MIRACWVPLCGVGLAYVIAGPIAAGEGREAPDAAAKGVRCLLPADLGWEVVECVQADELPALSLPSRPTVIRPPSDEATFVVLTIRTQLPPTSELLVAPECFMLFQDELAYQFGSRCSAVWEPTRCAAWRTHTAGAVMLQPAPRNDGRSLIELKLAFIVYKDDLSRDFQLAAMRPTQPGVVVNASKPGGTQ